MKKLAIVMSVGLVFGLMAVNVRAACGSCGAPRKEDAPKKGCCPCAATQAKAGACSILDSVNKLDLAEDQQAEIQKICKGGKCPEKPEDKEAAKEWRKKRAQCRKDVMAVLTKEQKTELKKIMKADAGDTVRKKKADKEE